jgi:hypothetical protein
MGQKNPAMEPLFEMKEPFENIAGSGCMILLHPSKG